MNGVICFGEALIDFLNTGKVTDDGLVLNDYRQYPGGAPANAAVAVAKLGGSAFFAGQVGQDTFGHFLESALNNYGVDTRFLAKHSSAKTALAFVTLDESGDRSFSFYRDGSADVLFNQSQVSVQWFKQARIFHFCSNTLTTADITKTTCYAVEQAIKHNALISFDVNLRHNLWTMGMADIERVNALVEQAHVVKFSQEEFDFLCQKNPSAYIKKCFTRTKKLIVITDGANDVSYFTPTHSGKIKPPSVYVRDTTAAGDAFIGGLLFALSLLSDVEQAFTTDNLKAILHFSAACGAYAATQLGAFPALPTYHQAQMLFANHKESDVS